MSISNARSWVRGLAVVPVAAALTFTATMWAGSEDCNNNGIPDAAEIAAGLVADCNGNGLPDPCEYAGVSAEGETGPFGDDKPLIVTIADASPAVSDLRLSIEVRADLHAIGEAVQAKVGDTVVATLWITDGQACPGDPQMQAVIVPMATVDAAIDANGGDLVVTIQSIGPVGVKECPDSFVFVAIDYVGDLSLPDCLGNGTWDGCDIAADPSLDCDGNGLIDACELAADPSLDCNGTGTLDDCDIAADPSLDCDGNGQIDSCEIAADPSLDCNGNGALNTCDLIAAAAGVSCDPDCDGDGVHDVCQIDADPLLDKNGDGLLDACQYARGDLTLDGVIDGADLAFMLGLWGTVNSPIGDLNADGLIDGADLAQLLGQWGARLLQPDCWATVLEVAPDPAVVTDPEWRERIIATGLPWRVRDNASQIEMLLVPPGTFMMGCSPSVQFGCNTDENPVHEVTLTQPFYIGRYEVTQAQWTAVMGSNPSWFQSPSSDVPAEQVPFRPVEGVSWNMIQGFETATGLRLPTEAQWEYACRAGTETAFNLPLNGTNDDGILEQLAWFGAYSGGNSSQRTHPVGQKQANNLGLHDMHGNVKEWVEGWYGSYPSTPQTDPSGPVSGTGRVLRGGSWFGSSLFCRASYRSFSSLPGSGNYLRGFRAARAP